MGALFNTSETNSGPLQEPKKGTKMDPRVGPAIWKTFYSRANRGAILGPSSLASANPVTQHAGGDRRPAFLSVSRRQEYGQ